jgi:hypothetical protein
MGIFTISRTCIINTTEDFKFFVEGEPIIRRIDASIASIDQTNCMTTSDERKHLLLG